MRKLKCIPTEHVQNVALVASFLRKDAVSHCGLLSLIARGSVCGELCEASRPQHNSLSFTGRAGCGKDTLMLLRVEDIARVSP